MLRKEKNCLIITGFFFYQHTWFRQNKERRVKKESMKDKWLFFPILISVCWILFCRLGHLTVQRPWLGQEWRNSKKRISLSFQFYCTPIPALMLTVINRMGTESNSNDVDRLPINAALYDPPHSSHSSRLDALLPYQFIRPHRWGSP